LQIEHRLALGLVLGLNNLLRFIFVASAKAGALAGGCVHAIILSTAKATAG
jgi:hypothetical protein